MIQKKKRDCRGFTLIEVLFAIVMLALSVSLLFTGIGTAGSINDAARRSQEKFYSELSVAEGCQTTGVASKVQFFVGGVTAMYTEVKILVHQADANALKSYRWDPTP